MNNESILIKEAGDLDASQLTDPEFLKDLRVQMLKFARLQLTDDAMAEDAVQEALIGALKNSASFNRRSALKTWVFAILKNKIADLLRKNNRMMDAGCIPFDQNDEENFDMLFNEKGRWHVEERPVAWAQPMEAVKNDHFWRVFETCLNGLPESQARIFMMREFLELDSSEICKTLSVTTSNLHVTLYRARLRLRECLENRWFSENEGERL